MSQLPDRIRRHRQDHPDDPIDILIESGTYTITAPLTLDTSYVSIRSEGDTVIRCPDPHAIQLHDCHQIRVERIRFDGTGIRVTGGSEVTLKQLEVTGAAIEIEGGDRTTLERCDHRVEACGISDGLEGPALSLRGVGIDVDGCKVEDWSGTAVLVDGNEHRIRRSHFTRCVEGIRQEGDWAARGLTIRENRFSGIIERAICLDRFASGAVVQGNVIHDTKGILIGGGRNHRIANNIFADCSPAISVDSRGTRESDEISKELAQLYVSFESRKPLEPPYSIRYPDLKEVAAYYFHKQGVPPEGNLVTRNIVVGQWIETDTPATEKLLAVQNNFVSADPGFTDLASRDLTLEDDAEVFELGFKPLPDEILRPQ